MPGSLVRVVAAALAALTVSVPVALASRTASRSFSFGVAAGEVTSTSAILWGRANRAGTLTLEVARDRRLRRAVRRFRVRATRARDLTVERRVTGLRPGARYFYGFRRGGARSARGTFVTAPRSSSTKRVRFAWSGDYDASPAPGKRRPYWNDFGVFRRMQAEHNQFNVALGDTIYSDSEVPGRLRPIALTVRQKWAKYRLNLGQAKLDRLRGSAGFYSHFDDHEFINDFARGESTFMSGNGNERQTVRINGQTLFRDGLRAFRDYAPVSYSRRDGLYRTRRWGRNLELFFLDERSFRSPKASAGGKCDNPMSHAPDLAPTGPPDKRALFSAIVPSLAAPVSKACLAAIDDPRRTLLGSRQLSRFLRAVKRSRARFKVVINELPIQQYYALPYDRWEGYEADRQRVLSGLRGVRNLVFLTTDVHATLVNDARLRTLEAGGPVNSGILDVTVGPAATETFSREIGDAVGVPTAGMLIDNVFFEPQPPAGVGMRCSGVDQASYGEVTVTSTRMTIQPKDIRGRPLVTDDGRCGPFVFDFRR